MFDLQRLSKIRFGTSVGKVRRQTAEGEANEIKSPGWNRGGTEKARP